MTKKTNLILEIKHLSSYGDFFHGNIFNYNFFVLDWALSLKGKNQLKFLRLKKIYRFQNYYHEPEASEAWLLKLTE